MNYTQKLTLGLASSFALLVSTQLNADVVQRLDRLVQEELPVSVRFKSDDEQTQILELPMLNVSKLKREDEAGKNKPQPYRFAIPYTQKSSYNDSGKWVNVGDTAVWKLTVFAPKSQSLNFGFDNVFLPQGAKLFIYSEDSKEIVVFNDSHNKNHGQIWTPVFETEKVTVELNTPVKMKEFTQFSLKHINQGYRSINRTEMAKSGSCNVDVICPEGNDWRNEIRSVARISIGGTGLCTGTLVNNVLNNGTPYFMSADHCGITSGTSASLVFYWNYETSVCEGTANGQLTQFNSGSTFRAGSDTSDFALVELDTVPDSAFNVFYAGWDNSDIAPSSAVGIHHPAGDEKRISHENDQLTITNYGANNTTANATHLRIGAWDSGTTEGGSSGSAIWNSAHHIVGTLTGGAASCSATDQPDWYGRMAKHWLGEGSNATQLKAWLDSTNTGATTLDGTGGCDAPTGTITVEPSPALFGEEVSFSIVASGGSGSGYTYDWDVNGDGVTDSTTDTANYTYNYFYRSSARVYVTDDTGCRGVVSAAVVVNSGANEVFLGSGNMPSGWAKSANSTSAFAVNSSGAFEGTYTLKASDIGDNQTSDIQVTHNFDAASDNFIAFAAKTSSEDGYDFLVFYVDGTEMMSLSGDSEWQTYYFPLSQGSHTLRWAYEKDESVSEGGDTAWVDGVTGIPTDAGTSGGGSTGGSSGGGSLGLGVLGLLLLSRLRRTKA